MLDASSDKERLAQWKTLRKYRIFLSNLNLTVLGSHTYLKINVVFGVSEKCGVKDDIL